MFRKSMFAILALTMLLPLTVLADTGTPRSIRMEVNGLVCAFCAHGIKKALGKYDAATDVFVDLEHRLVAVGLAAGKDIPDRELTVALTDAGYTVVSIQRSDQTLDAIKAAHGGGDE